MAIAQQITYGNAEVRGRLRQWKQQLARHYATFDSACQDQTRAEITNMVRRSSPVGRQRAFKKIRKSFGPGVTLESARLEGKYPQAIWSILEPRGAVAVLSSPGISERRRRSLMQDCVTINYIVTGYLPGFDRPAEIGLEEGLWTLEVPDHALGRAVERSRLLHPGTLIREAHANLLALPLAVLYEPDVTDDTKPGLLIKAGPGCFVGHFNIGRDVSYRGEFCCSFRVRTWLHDDQLHADQVPLTALGKPGERLGDSWLVPRPLCDIRPKSAESNKVALHICVWNPTTTGKLSRGAPNNNDKKG